MEVKVLGPGDERMQPCVMPCRWVSLAKSRTFQSRALLWSIDGGVVDVQQPETGIPPPGVLYLEERRRAGEEEKGGVRSGVTESNDVVVPLAK